MRRLGGMARKTDDDILARRRNRFFDDLKEGVALLFAAPEAAYGHDIHHRYRPDPDLFYLTGFAEPDAAGVFDADRRRVTLFVRPKDRLRETWEGRRAGPEGAVRDFGADEAYPVAELPKRLPKLIRKARVLHHAIGAHADGDRLVASLLARFRREARHKERGPVVVSDPTDLLHERRLVKDEAELAHLRASASIAAAAHRDAMALARPGRHEYELEAAIEGRFKAGGASGPSYPTIVASGVNATILHYVENRRRLEDGDLVLVDAGCELHGYASDITRTFPASGRFTKVTRRFYEIVLESQRAALAKVRPGVRFDDVHEAAREVLVEGLLELKVLRGKAATVLKKKLDKPFVLHRTSHWLGLDVHDRGRYTDREGRSRVLVPGMVLTVEPGLYVRPDEKRVPPALRGLGVRIEDDVLVTDGEPEILTREAPKEVDSLEALVGSGA